MAALVTVKGPNLGQRFALERDGTLIGRQPDAAIYLESLAISRQHARVACEGGSWFVEDLGSSNGTFVNGARVHARTPLTERDLLQIGPFVLSLRTEAENYEGDEGKGAANEGVYDDGHESRFDEAVVPHQPLVEAPQRWEKLLDFLQFLQQGPVAAPAGNVKTHHVKPQPGWSVEEECRQLRESLEVNHVRAEYPPPQYRALREALESADSPARQLLSAGFNRFALLDVRRGLGADGAFDLERFFDYVAKELVRVFDLTLDPEVVFGEDIAQILKDSPPSLLCFFDVQLVPSAQLARLRNFSQEHHRALMLLEANPLAGQEAVAKRLLTGLFNLFPQVDHGALVVEDEGSGDLTAKANLARRRWPDWSTFSPGLVRRCLEVARPFLESGGAGAAMCVPVCGGDGKAFGVIQLDTQDRSKEFTEDDLKLLSGAADLASFALENARLREAAAAQERLQRELETANLSVERLKRDLELSRQVQRSFLPQRLPQVPGYEFAAHYEAAMEVGGDYYGFVELPQGRLAVALGDVAGKGIPAALLMARLSADVRFSLLSEPDVARAVRKLNDLLCEYTADTRFVTLAVAVLDPASHAVTLVSAGFSSPLVRRQATGLLQEAVPREKTSVPLGIMPDYDGFETCEIALAPGDTLLMFTDGVTEAIDMQNTIFGMQRLKEAVQGAAPATAQAVVQRLALAVKQHCGDRAPIDDLAIVALDRLP
jgi:serine phosphatase RsbU (regulator of sigma subunit)